VNDSERGGSTWLERTSSKIVQRRARGTERARIASMPVPYPHHYQTWLVRTLSSRARVEAPPRPLISGGPPPEFDGDATAWSAEQLLLSSIGMCLLTTFEAFAAHARVDLLAWEARVSGVVDRTERGPELTRFTVELDMEVVDVERARATLDEAQQHCLITNALRAPVEVIARIRPAARKAG
jgi:organic hydroperoxide reductase OsmC/OhrA